MQRLVVCLMLVSGFVLSVSAQTDDTAARLERLERQVESLRFAIQAAEQRTVELTFLLQAQEITRYEKIRYTSSADGRTRPPGPSPPNPAAHPRRHQRHRRPHQ